jgi:hypothetical protein
MYTGLTPTMNVMISKPILQLSTSFVSQILIMEDLTITITPMTTSISPIAQAAQAVARPMIMMTANNLDIALMTIGIAIITLIISLQKSTQCLQVSLFRYLYYNIVSLNYDNTIILYFIPQVILLITMMMTI